MPGRQNQQTMWFLKMKTKRIYISWDQWEEVKANMWGRVSDRKSYLSKAIEFTSNHQLYGFYMLKVVDLWPNSCLNALTDYSLNRKAWIGHAACAMALNCPEDITREAWRYLTNEQQFLANNQAAAAIQKWEYSYAKSKGIRISMAAALL